MAGKSGRTISAHHDRSWRRVIFQWETFLIVILLAVNIMNRAISPNYFKATQLFSAINQFLVKGFIALPMAYILILGEIDLSVGSIVALSATLLGVSYNSGLPMWVSVLVALACGLVCGLINGLILVKFQELAPMIVTLGTQTLYRGICSMILGNESTGGLHAVESFKNIYYAKIGPVYVMTLVFLAAAVVFGLVLHKTTFGRWLYAIGSNRTAAQYSAVPVQKVRLVCYVLIGLVSGVVGILYASWMGTIRSDIATGYELEAISMCVLGGISTAGGKGNFPGAVIAVFIIGLLRYGLGLVNITGETMLVVIGVILILVVMIPNFNFRSIAKRFKKEQKSQANSV